MPSLYTNTMNDEKLIDAVHFFPCLWKVNSRSYKDIVAKDNAWKQLSCCPPSTAVLQYSNRKLFVFYSIIYMYLHAGEWMVCVKWLHISISMPSLWLIYTGNARCSREEERKGRGERSRRKRKRKRRREAENKKAKN